MKAMKTVKVLMIVAHPDDEVIFGFRDLILNDTYVICMTNGSNEIRRKEFFNSMKISGANGFMYDLPDDTLLLANETWPSAEEFYNTIKQIIRQTKYEIVVSHGGDGEYGHPQHILTHDLAKYVAKLCDLPFKTFRQRYRPSDTINHSIKYNSLIKNYSSQKLAINGLINFFEKKTPAKNGKIALGQIPDLRPFTK